MPKIEQPERKPTYTISKYKINKDDSFFIRSFLVFTSMALSIFLFIDLEIPNKDGFLYLETANLYINNGLDSAFSNYSWPFFSIIAALITQLTGISIAASFYTISTLSFGILAYAYSKISEFYFDKTGIIIAVAVFLCSETINSYRAMIIRDHGYWALTLLGIFFLIKAIKGNCLKSFLTSVIVISLSIFFRVEGIINLVIFPIIFLLKHQNTRTIIKRYKYLAFWLVISTSFGTIIALSYSEMTWKLISDLNYYMSLETYTSKLTSSINIINQYILPKFSTDYAIPFMITGLTAILAIKIFTSIGTSYLIITLTSHRKFFEFFPQNKEIALIVVSIALPLILFLYQQYFLSTRYAALLSILLLIPVSYVFYFNLSSKRKVLKWLSVFLLIYSLIDGLISFNHTSKKYFIDATAWITNNISADKAITTNDARLNYLLNGVFAKAPLLSIENISSDKSDVIVLSIKRNDLNTERQVLITQQWDKKTEFHNNKNDRIVIFSRIQN